MKSQVVRLSVFAVTLSVAATSLPTLTYAQKSMPSASGIHKTGMSKQKAAGVSQRSALEHMARIIHSEARGESFQGQVAVGAVVLNRVESGQFPDSVADVIFQPGQFSAVDDGQYNLKPNASAYRAARAALNGTDPTNGALYYYNPELATAAWSKKRPAKVRIGNHVFTR